MTALSIRSIIQHVTSGSLRVPAFQRGFVWDPDRVAFFMDSIYKGYPFGSVILWRTKTQLKWDKKLGPFPLPEHDEDFPIDYVLDGQQRLTSIFGTFQTEISPTGPADWRKIYYDLGAAPNHQDSQFLYLPDDEVDTARHFPIGVFFDVAGFLKATAGFDPDVVERIAEVQNRFQQAAVPVQLVETDERAKVAIVFERVNRLGVRLEILQLLSAWTWSEDFDLQNKFQDLADDLKPFGFNDINGDENLLLRCCAAIVKGSVSPDDLMNQNGAEVRDRFPQMVNGIRGAIDFLKANLKVASLANLPYPALLIPLTVFFASPDGKSVGLSETQRATLLRWFWRACFSRRYSAGVGRSLNRDIEQARILRQAGKSELAEFAASVGQDYFLQNFSINTVSTKVFILLLAQASPLGFVSGNPIALTSVLQAYNRNEFHHLFPRAFLGSVTHDSPVNALANFAFMSSVENKRLGGGAPSGYRKYLAPRSITKILDAALCSPNLFDDDYDSFVTARSRLLTKFAKNLMA